MQLIMSGVLNVLQLVGVTTSIWTMDSVGRRKLLLVGAALMAISHIVIAILVGKFSNNWPAHRPQGWASVAMLLFYMISFGASWGPIPWALPSGMEILITYPVQPKYPANIYTQKSSLLLCVPRVSLYQPVLTGLTTSLS
jgi:MFS family permease